MQLSRKSYIQKLRQMRQARQAESESAQQAGIPAGAAPEAVARSEAPAASAAAPMA